MIDMSSVSFRFRWALDDEAFRITGDTKSVTLRAEPETVATLLAPRGEQSAWQSVATVRLDISDSQHAILSEIAGGRLPEGCDLSHDVAGNVPRWLDGQIKVLVLPVLPKTFRDFVQTQRDDLSTQARRFVDLLRWATNARAAHNPFGVGVLEFSLDGTAWVSAPKNPPGAPVDLHVGFGISTDAFNCDVISDLALAGQSEPVGHSLIREALDLRAIGPRAAVVLGAAAAETAVKETIHRLVPSATYLVDEVSSPPVVKLLSEYLPQLDPIDERFRAAFPPPKPIRRSLEWLVQTRNRVVHNREQRYWFPELHPALMHVRDLVWLLDCYCGHDWAYGHISAEIREQLQIQRT